MKAQTYILCLLSFVMVGCVGDIALENNNEIEEKLTTNTVPADGQMFYYYGIESQKIYLNQAKDKVFVKFAPDATKEQFRSFIAGNATLLSKVSNPEAYFIEGYSSNTIILEGGEVSPGNLDSFKSREEIVSATFLLEYNGSKSAYTNEIIVKLKARTSFEQLQQLADEAVCQIGKEDEFVKNQYILHVSKKSDLDAIQTANLLYETGLFEFAEPNLIDIYTENSFDTYFTSQWGLKNTGGLFGGTAGVDINVEPSWAITKGNPNIRIAVIDSGVDLTHPDLRENLLAGYDATGLGTAGGPYYDELWNGSTKIRDGDSHGTSVAGIIAARQNNIVNGSYEGISGVAPNCKIVPVKASVNDNFERAHSSAAINWVANNNKAEVINCSFGSQNPPTSNLTNAINNAINRGCVVVASTSNDGLSSVGYPANIPGVIAVGAINEYGSRASFSNYGTWLDVVAPGTNIFTTDRQGTAGYNPNKNPNIFLFDLNDINYTYNFNGTSAAAPHVSGIAALILSVNPNLTQKQVVDAIEQSARKVGGYSYTISTGHINGAWANETGYGLVDAYRAIRFATTPWPSGGTIGSDQTIPIGTAPNPFTNVTSASGGYGQLSYQWQRQQGDNTPWYDLYNGTGPTYSDHTLTTPGIYSYRRKVSDEVGRGASSNTIKVTVTVQGTIPLSGGAISPATQTVSANSTPAMLRNSQSASGGNAAITYQWQSGTNGIGWTHITGATNAEYSPPRLTTLTYFRRMATSGNQTAYSNQAVVTVTGGPLSGGEIRSPAVVDLGSQHGPITNILGASGGTGSYSYQWQSSSPANPTNFTNVPGATGLEYQPPVASLPTPGSGPGPFLAILYRRMVTSGSEVAYSNTVPLMVWNR